jgi:hypothetical protein
VQHIGILAAQRPNLLLVLTDSARMMADSLRRDSLARPTTSSEGVRQWTSSTSAPRNLFQPSLPDRFDPELPPRLRDELVLILTGDVEDARDLVVYREKDFIAIPQVGQINVANLTMEQLETCVLPGSARSTRE